MLNNHNEPLVDAQSEVIRRPGDVEPFPSGRITYLAPLPLPTAIPPYGPHIGELNDGYMDFGLGLPEVFTWQLIFGGPTAGAFMIIVLFPLVTGLPGIIFGYGNGAIWESMVGVFEAGYENQSICGPLILLIGLGVWHHAHKKRLSLIPTRFNRQRR